MRRFADQRALGPMIVNGQYFSHHAHPLARRPGHRRSAGNAVLVTPWSRTGPRLAGGEVVEANRETPVAMFLPGQSAISPEPGGGCEAGEGFDGGRSHHGLRQDNHRGDLGRCGQTPEFRAPAEFAAVVCVGVAFVVVTQQCDPPDVRPLPGNADLPPDRMIELAKFVTVFTGPRQAQYVRHAQMVEQPGGTVVEDPSVG